MKTVTRSRRTRLAAALVAAPLALSLVACGSDSDDNDADDRDDAATTSAATPVAPTSAAPGTSSAPADTPAAPTGGLEAAALTALAAVDGSTLFSVDRNDSGAWEVSVVDAAGIESDLTVSADGSTITDGPVGGDDGDDGDDDNGDDLAERQRLLGTQVDYLGAIEAASASVPGATVTGVDLDEDNGGVATWDVQFDEDTADETTVDIDADSGAVLRTERDD